MDGYRKISDRFGFDIPTDYRRFWEAGVLTKDASTSLHLSRFWWLSPEEIARIGWPFLGGQSEAFKIPPFNKIGTLVPFACTPGGDHYCWHMQPTGGSWIADCPRDSDVAIDCAPNFEGFLFRSLLEEFTDTWLTSSASVAAMLFRQYAGQLGPLLPPKWGEMLLQLALREPTLRAHGYDASGLPVYRPGVLSEEEASAILKNELAFPGMDKEFKQHFP